MPLQGRQRHRFGRDRERVQHVHAAAQHDGEHAREARDFADLDQSTQNRHPEQRCVRRIAGAGATQHHPKHGPQADYRDQHIETIAPRKIGNGNQASGQERQFALHIDEHFHHFRHHISQETRDHQHGSGGQHRWIDHREAHALLHAVARFDIVSQPSQHQRQVSGAFTGTDRRAIGDRKNLRELVHATGQRLTFQNARANSQRHAIDHLRIGLARDRRQHIIERQTGAEEGTQQAREQGQIFAGHAHRTEAQRRRGTVTPAACRDRERRELLLT